uniref:Uncharacterized protein n=1 Tax=Arundo donax TaxID=35708 RepID=A0A0A9F880_ARUDO
MNKISYVNSEMVAVIFQCVPRKKYISVRLD